MMYKYHKSYPTLKAIPKVCLIHMLAIFLICERVLEIEVH